MDGTAADQVERRSRITDGLLPEILLDVQETLQTNHLNFRELKATYEVSNTNSPDYRSAESRRPVRTHARTSNEPTVNEVAVLRPNDSVGQRYIIFHT